MEIRSTEMYSGSGYGMQATISSEVLIPYGPCLRKIRYASKKAAKRRVRIMKTSPKYADTDGLKAYACKFCQGWHIGHRRWKPVLQ